MMSEPDPNKNDGLVLVGLQRKVEREQKYETH